jgi:hypothetical protein
LLSRRMKSCTAATLLAGYWLANTSGAYAAKDALLSKTPESLPWCGSLYAPPFASPTDGKRKRICEPAVARAYTLIHRNIGAEALDLESRACFVPDSAYRLLDDIIDTVTARMGPIDDHLDHDGQRVQILNVSRITGQVLAEKGFGLYIPTDTLGDALVPRSAPGEAPRHVIDCDTGALVLLSVAEALGLKAALVEVTLESGAGHNFARWQLTDNSILDWDTNGRAECSMQLNNPTFQGRAMTHDQTVAYLLLLAGARWEREGHPKEAINNYSHSIALHPEHPAGYNNFVWALATKSFPERESFRAEATRYLPTLMAIQRLPNYLDTAACMAAYDQDFQGALAYAKEALKGDPGNGTFAARVAQFESAHPHDCTGEE